MGVAIIHVVDEEAHTSKEYRCDIRLLLAHMKLLAADMQDVPGHDTEITVKSDIQTFDWLMAYVKAETRGHQPEIVLSNSIQLLLASHYLKMSPVLKSSVAFIAQHLLELAPTAAGQLCSLQTCLIEKVAQVVQEEVLEALFQTCSQQQHAQHSSTHTASTNADNQQRSSSSYTTTTSSSSSNSSMAGLLVEKLYKHKLRALLQQQSTTLLRCRACGQLFASASSHTLQCAAASTSANRPRRLPLHDPDPSWDLQCFLTEQRSAAKAHQRCSSASDTQLPHPAPAKPYQHAGSCVQHLEAEHALSPHLDLEQEHQRPFEHSQQQQRQQQAMSWRELYWLAWGHAVVLYCQRCCNHFPARLLHECRYHPLPAVFESDVTAGRYPCCGAPAWHPGAGRPTSAAAAGGAGGTGQGPCCSRDHDAYLAATSSSSSNSAGNSRSGSPACAQTPAAAASAGSRAGRRGPKGATGVEAGRALQLCRLYRPLITAAVPAVRQQQQEGGGRQAGLDAGGACTGLRRPASQQQQQHTLPLLVKMVDKGAASAAAAAAAAPAGRQAPPSAAAAAAAAGGRTGSSSTSRSVSPLPPIVSPREQHAHTQARARSPLGGSRPQQDNGRQQQQQQAHSLPSASSAHAGSTQISSKMRPSDPEEMCGNRSRSRSRSGSSRGSSSRSEGDYDIMYVDGDRADHRSRSSTHQEAPLPLPGDADSQHSGSSNTTSNDSDGDDSGSLRGTQSIRRSYQCSDHGTQQQQQQLEPLDAADLTHADAVASAGSDSEAACSDVDAGDMDELDDLRLLSAHATPLSSVLGAVRAAADARTRGGGLGSSSSSSTGPGGSSAAGRLMGSQVGAPLADTFSAGGRRVLTNAGRKQHPSSQADRSRPSTAASMLSLTQQRQRVGQQQQEAASRPVFSSSRGGGSGRVHVAAAGAAAAAAVAGLTEDGGVSSIGAAYNRTLLLELVQQDDAYRMAVLMRKLDSMRLQPPPNCAAGSPHKQQLSQVDVMHAVNGVLFAGRAPAV